MAEPTGAERLYEHVIMLEFNELVPHLMDRWIADGLLPNFRALRDRSLQFVTEADVKSPAELEPWIQWYSIHTGLSYNQHGVFHLTDGPRAKHRDIFDVLGDEGLKIGCCGSMNIKSFSANRGFYIADPWCDGQSAQPEELNTFQNFISQYVREYSNPDPASRPINPVQFLAFMATHGLSAKTVARTLAQLTQEKVKDKNSSWQRVALLDRLTVDLFKHLYRRYRPDFATFFSNSTAHLQHSYWRHMDPEPFKVKPTQEQIDIYGGAIKFGYVMMDQLVGEIVALAKPRDLIVFATALSQQPFLRKEGIGGQLFYRPHDIAKFLNEVGVMDASVEPVMTHQFRLRFQSKDAVKNAIHKLEGLRTEALSISGISDRAEDGFIFGCGISQQLPPEAVVAQDNTNKTFRFFDIFYQIDGMKSGCHHPDGMLWLATGQNRDMGRCSILDIFPTILEIFGRTNAIPSDRKGVSLLQHARTRSIKH